MKFVFVFFLVSVFALIDHYREFYFQQSKINLAGEWVYQFSWVDGQKEEIEGDIHCPVYKMEFYNCDDSKELKKMPLFVVNQRKINVLKNLCTKTYNKEGVYIDTYFPVIEISNGNSDTLISVVNYGQKYKSEYIIDKLFGDTLVVYNDKILQIGNREFKYVRHVYHRNK